MHVCIGRWKPPTKTVWPRPLLQVVRDYGELDTGQPATLSAFLQRALERFPPSDNGGVGASGRKYFVVYWDHGSGEQNTLCTVCKICRQCVHTCVLVCACVCEQTTLCAFPASLGSPDTYFVVYSAHSSGESATIATNYDYHSVPSVQKLS